MPCNIIISLTILLSNIIIFGMELPNIPITARVNGAIILESLKNPFISAILGPRRVGKSTFIAWYMESYSKHLWVSLNMDILSQRKIIESEQLQSEIERQALQKIGAAKKIWVAIDEAQKCPELFEQIKVIYDLFKDKNSIKFILTGSASLDLHNLAAESLAGRIDLLDLREFTIRETAQFNNSINISGNSLLDQLAEDHTKIKQIITAAMPYQSILHESLQLQLVYGGLPEVMALQSARERFRYLDQYIQSYLEKDVRKITEITNLDLYQKLLAVLAEYTGSLRDDSRLLESLGCARNTLKKYRGYLIATKVFQEVFPVMQDSLKRIIKSPKGYIQNNGILSVLTGLDNLNILKKSGKIGYRLENWFLKELQVWLDRSFKRQHIYFWRTTRDREVDFIVEQKPNLIPFEVTYSTIIDSRKINNLVAFMQQNKNCACGVLIYNGTYLYKPDLKIHCIPAWTIC